MALFKLKDIEFDVGEYSHERVLWVDILVRGERTLSEPIKLDNEPRGKNLIELVRLSETTVKAVFNGQLHSPGFYTNHTVDVILRNQDHLAVASAFQVERDHE